MASGTFYTLFVPDYTRALHSLTCASAQGHSSKINEEHPFQGMRPRSTRSTHSFTRWQRIGSVLFRSRNWLRHAPILPASINHCIPLITKFILAFTCVFGVIASVMVVVLHTFSICHLETYKLTYKLDLIQNFN